MIYPIELMHSRTVKCSFDVFIAMNIKLFMSKLFSLWRLQDGSIELIVGDIIMALYYQKLKKRKKGLNCSRKIYFD